jgi:hypothetical protein
MSQKRDLTLQDHGNKMTIASFFPVDFEDGFRCLNPYLFHLFYTYNNKCKKTLKTFFYFFLISFCRTKSHKISLS